MERMGFGSGSVEDGGDELDDASRGCGEDAMRSSLPTPPEPRIFPMDDLLKGDGDVSRCGLLLSLDKLGKWDANRDRWVSEESNDAVKVKKEEMAEGNVEDTPPTKPKPPGNAIVPSTPPPVVQDHGCQTVRVPASGTGNALDNPDTLSMPPPPSNVEAAWINFMGGFVGVLAVGHGAADNHGVPREEIAFDGVKIKVEPSSSPPRLPSNNEKSGKNLLLERELHDTIHSIITLDDVEDPRRLVRVQAERNELKCPECLHCMRCAKRWGIGDGDEDCQPLLQMFSQSVSSSSDENLKSIRTKSALRSSDESGSVYEDETFSKARTPTFTANVTKSITVTCSSESDSADSVLEADRLWFPVADGGNMLVYEAARGWGVIPFNASRAAADVHRSGESSLSQEWGDVSGREYNLGSAREILEDMAREDGIGVRRAKKMRDITTEGSQDNENASSKDREDTAADCRPPAEEQVRQILFTRNMIWLIESRWYQFRIWRQSDETD